MKTLKRERRLPYLPDNLRAAISYIQRPTLKKVNTESSLPWMWPFSRKRWRPTPENRIAELTKAIDFINDEIERLGGKKHAPEDALHTAFCAGAKFDMSILPEGVQYHAYKDWMYQNRQVNVHE